MVKLENHKNHLIKKLWYIFEVARGNVLDLSFSGFS